MGPEDWGIEVKGASDGRADAVVPDLMLPGPSGFDVAGASGPTTRCRIVRRRSATQSGDTGP